MVQFNGLITNTQINEQIDTKNENKNVLYSIPTPKFITFAISYRTMKFIYSIIITLSLCVNISMAQNVERVAPIFGTDDQANMMIRYISDNLELMIPNGKTLENVNGMMRCKISIEPSGKIYDIQIIKGVTDAKWLDIIIMEGLLKIPPSPMWRAPAKHQLSKALIFSFGRHGYHKKTYGPNQDAVQANLDNHLNKWARNLRDSMTRHQLRWEKKTSADIKLPMPASPDGEKQRQPDLNTPPLRPNLPDLPKVEISLE